MKMERNSFPTIGLTFILHHYSVKHLLWRSQGRKAEVGGNNWFTSGFAEQKFLSSTDARHSECFANLSEMLLVTFLVKKSFIVFYSDDFWSYGAWPSIMPMLCRGYFNFKGIALFNNPLKFTMRSLCVQRGQKHVENLGMVVGSTLMSFE